MIPNSVLLDLRDAVSEMSRDRFASQSTVLSCHCESAQMLCRSQEKNSFP